MSHQTPKAPTSIDLGTSNAIRRVMADCQRYATTPYPILILGERGTGKTMLAGHIHALSGRRGNFIKESAASLTDEMGHALLAGHARGTFTGATDHRQGLIEAAHLGTFFLDELGVASPRVQQVLLQLLDDGALLRVGEVRRRPIDTRFIAATNADLSALAAAGTFRHDLRDRFGYLTIEVPPLRERRADILPLARRFLERESIAAKVTHAPALSEEVEQVFLEADWSYNVRQLLDVCRFAMLNSLPEYPITMAELPPGFVAELEPGYRDRFMRSLSRRAAAVLQETGGNKAETARRLGVSRRHIYRLLSG